MIPKPDALAEISLSPKIIIPFSIKKIWKYKFVLISLLLLVVIISTDVYFVTKSRANLVEEYHDYYVNKLKLKQNISVDEVEKQLGTDQGYKNSIESIPCCYLSKRVEYRDYPFSWLNLLFYVPFVVLILLIIYCLRKTKSKQK